MEDTKIKFILNNDFCEISSISPNVTVLEFLREYKKLTGTKEGCAEGDCGACTVIIGEIDKNKKIKYKSVNACIMPIAMLHGKHLISIEYFNKNEKNTIQTSMIDNHASQCGFCTPGFMMSTYALKHNIAQPTTHEIQNAIAGNLCRCTGYKPIIKAIKNSEEFQIPTPINIEKILKITSLNYQHNGQYFFSPRTLDELLKLKNQHKDAYIISGSTDIGLWITKEHQELKKLIYIGNIEELKIINDNSNNLEIGAACIYSDIFPYLTKYDKTIEELSERFASKQIRNSATMVGNIANGSPIGDGAPLLIMLDAKLQINSANSERIIAVADFFIDYGVQDIKKDEVITKIIIPKRKDNSHYKIYKISKRFEQDISAICAGYSVKLKNNIIEEIILAYGGMAAIPKRATEVEKYLIGKKWQEDIIKSAMQKLEDDFTPIDDMRASAKYRMQVAKNMLLRFFIETTEDNNKVRVYNYEEL